MGTEMNEQQAYEHWQRCKPYIAAAVELVDTHTIEDVEDGIAAGAMAFWPGEHSAAVTEVHQYPRVRYLHVTFAGGDLDELRAMVPAFMSFGRFCGCTKISLLGRPGWERALRQQGWKKTAVGLAVEIPPEVRQ